MIDKYLYKEILVSDYKMACENYKGNQLLTRNWGFVFFIQQCWTFIIYWMGEGF